MSRLLYLEREDVESIAHRLAAELFRGYADPLPAFRLRDKGELLESALGLRQGYYPTLYAKAGALLRSLIKNHPLIDGNKRTGMAATFIFLLFNERVLVASNDEMVRFALEVANSRPAMPWQDVADWLRRRAVRLVEPEATLRSMKRRLPNEWRDIAALDRRLQEYKEAIEAARLL